MVSYAAKPQTGGNAYASKAYDQASYLQPAEVYATIPQPVFVEAPILEEVDIFILID